MVLPPLYLISIVGFLAQPFATCWMLLLRALLETISAAIISRLAVSGFSILKEYPLGDTG